MPTAPATRRTPYIDILICMSTFAVVWLHTNGYAHSYSDSVAWKSALAVEVIAYWAVPIFLMCSGVNLMRYRERYSTRDFLVKRVQKAVIPFVFWVLLSYVLVTWAANGGLTWADFSPRAIYEAFMTLNHMSIYWFFLALFAIYLAMPVLSLLRDRRRILWYIVIVGLVFDSVLPLIAQIFSLPFNHLLDFPLTGGRYVIFPILGYLLADLELPRWGRYTLYTAGAAAAVTRYLVTYIGSTQRGETYLLLFDYVSIVSVVLAAAVFVFIKSIDWEPVVRIGWIRATIRQITACSLGIYLTHYFFIMWLLPRLGWTPDRLITQTLGTVVVFLLALLLVSALRLIPGVRRVLPG
jgi:hypothetical protein